MASSILNSDDGVISGTSGLKSVGGDDGVLVFQSKGTETARINTDKQIVAAAGTASLPIYSTTGDLNTGIYFPAADRIGIVTGGTQRVEVDASGNVGIGGTSSGERLLSSGSDGNLKLLLQRTGSSGNAQMGFKNDLGTKYIGASGTSFYISTAADLGSAPQVVVDSSGNVMIGTTSPSARLTSYRTGGGAALFAHQDGATNDTTAFIRQTTGGGNGSQNIGLVVDIQAQDNADRILCLRFWNSGTPQEKFLVQRDGTTLNVNGTIGTISDQKLKQDIVDANSQWDDIKSLRVVNYRLKTDVEADPNHHSYIGLIAQEVEQISPGLIIESKDYEEIQVPVLDSDGNEVFDENGNLQTKTENKATGETTKSVKTSIVYMKAVKALQEAMERIETLEAKVSALEANNGA
jgi:hypothetical protein